MTDLSDQDLAEIVRHGSHISSALALVELCDRAGCEIEEILPSPGSAR